MGQLEADFESRAGQLWQSTAERIGWAARTSPSVDQENDDDDKPLLKCPLQNESMPCGPLKDLDLDILSAQMPQF